MIAMLLAAQISAATLPQATPLDTVLPPRGYIAPAGALVRNLPAKACPGSGRLETSFGSPTALYRRGDRPAKPLLRWVDYPDARHCLAEAAP